MSSVFWKAQQLNKAEVGQDKPSSVTPQSFKDLTDTPNSYSGQAGKSVKVKGDESGLEFGEVSVASNGLETDIYIKDFPRLESETNDTERFKRAIASLVSIGGGTLLLDIEEYFLDKFSIPDGIHIKGAFKVGPWTHPTTVKGTILRFIGSGEFITIESYYHKKAFLSNVAIRTLTPGRTNGQTAIVVKKPTNDWGSSAHLEQIAVNGFQVGIQHYVSSQSLVKNCIITECGIGISYKSEYPGISYTSEQLTYLFGNINLVEETTIYVCDIGVEGCSDTLFTYKGGILEQCKIAINVFKTGTVGAYPSSRWYFEGVWIENITKYVVCNAKVDSNFDSLGTHTVSLPEFKNCYGIFTPTYEISPNNVDYQTYKVITEVTKKQYYVDDNSRDFYNKTQHNIELVKVGNNSAHRDLFTLSNKGLMVKIGLNAYEKLDSYTTSGTTTQTSTIPYSDIVNMESGTANYVSSMALMSVTSIHNDGSVGNASFLINDFAQYAPLRITQIGTTFESWAGLLSGNKIEVTNIVGTWPTNRTFDVKVTGSGVKKLSVKINYFPSGLLVTN